MEANTDYAVQFISELKGRGLFAKRSYKKGDLIFEEKPLVCAQFAWNATCGYLACEYCMRPLETAEENVRRLSACEVYDLPFADCSPTDKTSHVMCQVCKAKYCCKQCQQEAWSQYHQTICNEDDIGLSPFSLIEETWKRMHFPPESSTIMLLVRIFATIEQAKDKEAVYQTFLNFCSRSCEDRVTLMSKLGIQYEERLEKLRKRMCECFPNASVSRAWLSEEGFQWLFKMVAVNGQGVGTSVFSQWVERVGDRVESSLIDEIYEKLRENSGCEFLNNEGSALYKLQSSCNHSCTPNAEVQFPYSNFVLNLVATQDISAGDEICISYMEEDMLERGREKRNSYLRLHYYFTCTCDKCMSQIGDPESESEEEEDEEEEEEEKED